MRRLGFMIAVLVFGLVSVGAALAATDLGRHGETAPGDLRLTAWPTPESFVGDAPATLAPKDEGRLRTIRSVPSGQTTPAARDGADEGAGAKQQKPITGAVVHDPDDCGDVCTDADPDADDAGQGAEGPDAGDGSTGPDADDAGPATGVDDDGDGDYDDCGDDAASSGGGLAGADDDGDGGDCGESGD